MITRKNKRAAMEMSVGTIVTIVLLVSVLVLGLFLVQRIFGSGINAIDSIDTQIQNEINQLFSTGETSKIAVYPTSREVNVKKGDDPKGFAFSVYNDAKESSSSFEYSIEADDVSDCGSTFTKSIADSYLLGKTGSFELGPTSMLENARLVRLSVPESAISCTIFYNINVKRDGVSYTGSQIIINID